MALNCVSHRQVFRRSRTCVTHGLLAAALLLGPFFVGSAHGQGQVPPVDITVRVTDAENEQPIDRAKIELLRFPEGVVQMAFVDSSGQILFSGLPPQSYNLRASKSGYETTDIRVDIRRGETFKNVDVRMQAVRSGAPGAAGVVSTRMLSIPAPALKEFQKGVEFLNNKKNPKRSLDHLREAIQLYPDYYEAYFVLGMALLQLNSNSEAQSALEKAIEINPQFIDPYYPLSVLLATQRQYDEAERFLLKAMELDPKDWKWPFELARCHANRGQWDKAMTYAEMAHTHPNPPPKIHILMADLYSGAGETAKAIEELEKFIKLDPKSPYVPRVKAALKQLQQDK